MNSPGGDCIAASRIYAMLADYAEHITVKIDGIAASAASVIAMAGTKVLMAPTALMMIHNPITLAYGNHQDMQKAIGLLDEVKESIINAYEIKTTLSRTRLGHLMDSETWMNANKAMELGFADGILEDSKKIASPEAYSFSTKTAQASLVNKITDKFRPKAEAETSTKLSELEKRLSLIKP
jgi:ATP-dependent Clp protease protease subunit